MKTKLSLILFLLIFTPSFLYSGEENISGNLDLKKLAEDIYDIYQTDDIPAKKEKLVYKKLNDLITVGTYTITFTSSDSIRYDKKLDKTIIKSKEVYYSDSKLGYMGIFVLASKSGDDWILSSSPGKEMTTTGRITDVIITGYRKTKQYFETYTPLKDFDDAGTEIQQIILVLEA